MRQCNTKKKTRSSKWPAASHQPLQTPGFQEEYRWFRWAANKGHKRTEGHKEWNLQGFHIFHLNVSVKTMLMVWVKAQHLLLKFIYTAALQNNFLEGPELHCSRTPLTGQNSKLRHGLHLLWFWRWMVKGQVVCMNPPLKTMTHFFVVPLSNNWSTDPHLSLCITYCLCIWTDTLFLSTKVALSTYSLVFLQFVRRVTTEKFQENLPVGRDADVFFIDVVVQEHGAWVLPCLFSETNPENRLLLNN